MLTLVETAGLIGPDRAFDSILCQLDLEHTLEFGIAGGIAAAAWICRGSLVSADEDVFLEFHRITKNARLKLPGGALR